MTLTILSLWYLSGIVLFLFTCYRQTKYIDIRDLLTALFAGILGFLIIMFVIQYGNFKILDKRIF